MMNKKQTALNRIAEEIKKCKECKKDKIGVSVPGEGDPNADIVFIGEAPGKLESREGRPFIGRSGQLLRGLIRDIGLKEEDVYITSPVKYLPVAGTPSSQEIAHGRIHLLEQFEVIQPKIVVLLGRVAAEGVLQMKVAVVKDHGQIIKEDPSTSSGQGNIKYFLTYHPAAVLRFSWKFKALVQGDFLKIKDIIS